MLTKRAYISSFCGGSYPFGYELFCVLFVFCDKIKAHYLEEVNKFFSVVSEYGNSVPLRHPVVKYFFGFTKCG